MDLPVLALRHCETEWATVASRLPGTQPSPSHGNPAAPRSEPSGKPIHAPSGLFCCPSFGGSPRAESPGDWARAPERADRNNELAWDEAQARAPGRIHDGTVRGSFRPHHASVLFRRVRGDPRPVRQVRRGHRLPYPGRGRARRDRSGKCRSAREMVCRTGKSTCAIRAFRRRTTTPWCRSPGTDAVSFCEWFSKKRARNIACRPRPNGNTPAAPGTSSRYYNGSDPEEVTQIANIADASAMKVFPRWNESVKSSDGYVYTSPVGRFRPEQLRPVRHAWQRGRVVFRPPRRRLHTSTLRRTIRKVRIRATRASDAAAASLASPVRATVTTESKRSGDPIGVSESCATSRPRPTSPCRRKPGRFTRLPRSCEHDRRRFAHCCSWSAADCRSA